MDKVTDKITKLLIVDDDQDDQFMLKKIFKTISPSTQIEQAFNGVDCFEYLESHLNDLPDVITMDLNMPLVNGIEATLQIKKDERFKHIPLIILTTSDRKEDKKTVMEYGANDFFIKPVIYEDLQATIKDITTKWISTKLS